MRSTASTLRFTPKLTITQLGGRKSTARGKEPGLQFNLNTTPGDANLKSVAVTLPRAFEIDQEHLGNLCDKTELATDQCKGKAAIGTVIDETPLLEQPLEGNAYAVTGLGGGVLPHVVFILGGQVTVMPEGESSTVKDGRLRTVIPVIPDVPIGHFRLSLYGGQLGYLSNTQSLCSSPVTSTVEIEAQNGKSLDQQVKAKTACTAKHKAKRHKAPSTTSAPGAEHPAETGPPATTEERDMDQGQRKRRIAMPSPAMAVAITALVVAMGGSAYAALQVPPNSVGARQLKAKAVTGGKIANGAVSGGKIAEETITGANIKLSALGTVPQAANATNAANASRRQRPLRLLSLRRPP